MSSAVKSYKVNKQIRIEKQLEFYKPFLNFNSIDDVKSHVLKNKWKYNNGYYICLIKLLNKETFYSIIGFKYNWLSVGNIIGRWNEIELIEKIK